MFKSLRRALIRAAKPFSPAKMLGAALASQKLVQRAAKLVVAKASAKPKTVKGRPAAKPAGIIGRSRAKPPQAKAPAAAKRGAAPRRVPPKTAFALRHFESEHGKRSYKLYTPVRFAPAALGAAKVPLVIMLHGCTQTPDDFATGTGMNLLAEEMGFIVAYPAQTREANRNKCWNWFRPADQIRDTGEPALIAGITQQIMQSHSVDAARIYVAGMSAGGAAALVVATTYPDLFAAVGVHSGLPLGAAHGGISALMAMRAGSDGHRHTVPLPTIVFHGADDVVVNPRNGRAIEARTVATFDGLQAITKAGKARGGHKYTRVSHRAKNGKSYCEHWLVQGAGHAWSGGAANGRFADPKGPDASRAMLRFFRQHPKTAPAV